MKKIGLTGGIASGKSSVALMISAAGVPVLNMDEIGRDLMQADRALVDKVHALCGIADSRWNPVKVREALFRDKSIKHKIEQLLHPLIIAEFERQLSELEARGEKLVICEAALLIEGGYHKALDELVVVMAPRELRKQRLMARDKIAPELAEKILDSQVGDAERTLVATTIIRNTGDLDHLAAQVRTLLDRWKREE